MPDLDRMPAVAGRFYPADTNALHTQVDGLLTAEPAEERDALMVVAPHAGYAYSGGVAGATYAGVRVPPSVVILGPNHTGLGARAAILTRGGFHIPGATIPVDASVAEEIRGNGLLTEDRKAHRMEHSIEVQLPFLVRKNPKLRIVPICLGDMTYASCARIGLAIADVVESHGREVLLVASTDMSHYLPAEEARRLDHHALEHIVGLDPEGLYETVRRERLSMCGFIPTTVALCAAKALGAKSAELVRYANSGDVSGDTQRVVGYAGLVIR
ncbi:MAG: AmmeMemoRadiSam system protein B [Deltaproteobacteria bacterium]|nr:AmmeMemoRadiSam system protein B [Deltaproteobacteria bacterium]